jgi:DNA invertase Pin-like site-specific DNA recombinase
MARTNANRTPALAYLRTSSATNVGADKDSEKRQRSAIEEFAKRAGYQLVGEHYDAAVSGADAIDTRRGFAEMLRRIAGNGVKTIIVETANRFARDLIVQETGHKRLRALGIDLIAADSPDAFVEDTRPRAWCARCLAPSRSLRRRPSWPSSRGRSAACGQGQV